MKILGFEFGRAEKRQLTPIRPFETSAASTDAWQVFLGSNNVVLPSVTLDSAMTVPAVAAAVMFMSRTLANLVLDVLRDTAKGPQPIGGRLGTIVRDAPNVQWSGFASRNFFWQSVFTQGRGLMLIVRDDRGQPVELWPLNPDYYRVRIDAFGRKTYIESATSKTFPAADVIDVPFFLCADQVNVKSPIDLGKRAIQLSLAMAMFGSTFFAGGGLPPLSVEGPPASNTETNTRAMADIKRSIDEAKASDTPIFRMPPGFKLNPVGYDPQKAQMVDALRFQIEEIARVFQIPPMFLQDLTRATFNNSEAQDLFLVKHLLSQWAKAFEDECNLKLFGQTNGKRYVRHNFDSLLRGDFATRMDGIVRSIQGGVRTPNEGRAMADLPAHSDPAADQLFMQGATVPIDQAQTLTDTENAQEDVQD